MICLQKSTRMHGILISHVQSCTPFIPERVEALWFRISGRDFSFLRS